MPYPLGNLARTVETCCLVHFITFFYSVVSDILMLMLLKFDPLLGAELRDIFAELD